MIVDKQTYAVGNRRASLPVPLLVCNLGGQENVPIYVYWNWMAMQSTLHLPDNAAYFNSKYVGDQIDIVYKMPEWVNEKNRPIQILYFY